VITRLLARLWCKHTFIIRRGHGRMWLECLWCDARSPGWTILQARTP
jgi:hypothetical protein